MTALPSPRDSNQGNIFLSREALERDHRDGTIEISAVSTPLPLYLTALVPRLIKQAEPAPGQEEDAFQGANLLRKAYHALYQDNDLDVVRASALSFVDEFSMVQQLPAAAQFCWHGEHIRLKQQLIWAVAEWQPIAGLA